MGTLLFRTGTVGEYVVAPRVETEVAIHVTGIIARTRVTQVFHNPGTETVEGVYVFPLPEKAAVDHLWVRIGERVIEGQIKEKEEARRTYEKAKSEGRKAALVEQQRPNLFTNSVAHIGPNEMVRITIEYQQALAYENGEYRLRFPLAVTPRYTPGGPAVEAMPEEPKALEARPCCARRSTPRRCATTTSAPARDFINPVDIVVMIDAGVPLAQRHQLLPRRDGREISRRHARSSICSRSRRKPTATSSSCGRPPRGATPKAAMFIEAKDGNDYALLMVMPPEPTAAERAAGRAHAARDHPHRRHLGLDGRRADGAGEAGGC